MDTSELLRLPPQYSKTINEIIFNSNSMVDRNPMDIHLKPIINIFLSDLTNETSINYLDDCYCLNKNTNKYNRQLGDIFSDKLPSLGIPVKDSSDFEKEFNQKEISLLKKSYLNNPEVMVLVGGVGAGKTTFLYRFFKTILPEDKKNDTIWINIDFTKESDENIDIKEYIYLEALDQIRSNYPILKIDSYETQKIIYYNHIERMKEGPYKPIYQNNPNEFEMKISEFLISRCENEVQFAQDILKYYSTDPVSKKRLCISLDNADQKSDDFQKRCILTAFDIAAKLNSLVILSMRDESYWTLRNTRPFDAFRGSAFYISPPKVSDALKKRIDVAIKHVPNQKVEIEIGNGMKAGIHIHNFLKIITNSLFEQEEHLELFDCLSANNLRFSMEILSKFLTSGHTNSSEYIHTYLSRGKYIIPFHALIRSIALGDYKYYHSDKSLLMNIFEMEDDGFYSHFTKLRILKYLTAKVNFSTRPGKGFVEIAKAFTVFQNICKNEYTFRNTLETLLYHRLIQSENGFLPNCRESKYIKISSAGHYYLTVLCTKFSFLERLCEDTMITSKEYFIQIEEKTNYIENEAPRLQLKSKTRSKKLIQARLERVQLFLDYLENEEGKEKEFIVGTEIDYTFMEHIKEAFTQEKNQILK